MYKVSVGSSGFCMNEVHITRETVTKSPLKTQKKLPTDLLWGTKYKTGSISNIWNFIDKFYAGMNDF